LACCSKLLRPLAIHPMDLAVSLDLSKQRACSHYLPELLGPFRVSGQPPDASQIPHLSSFQLGHWMHCLARQRCTTTQAKSIVMSQHMMLVEGVGVRRYTVFSSMT